MIKGIYIPVLSLFFAFSNLAAQDSNQETLIRQKAKAYVEAFNRHDPHAMAAFWAEDGEYVNPETGEVIEGRASIEEAFKSRFEEIGDVHVDIKINSVTFSADNEAIVTGLFRANLPGKGSRNIAFKAYYEKQKNGEWLIGEIRDIDIASVPNNYQHLKEIEWLIGEWVDKDEDVEINTSYKWDVSKNFIFGKFSVKTEEHLELEGTQIIGWDPIQEKIRSWIFDSDGTFGESSWTKKGNTWVVETAQTLANGSRASSISIYTPVDLNSYRWESSDREVGGQILPDISPIIINRKQGS